MKDAYFYISIVADIFRQWEEIVSSYSIYTRKLQRNSIISSIITLCKEQNTSSFINKMVWSLHTLPVHLIYRILDNVDDFTMIVSCRNICKRLNDVTDSYYRYQVILDFIRNSVFQYVSTT